MMNASSQPKDISVESVSHEPVDLQDRERLMSEGDVRSLPDLKATETSVDAFRPKKPKRD